MDNRSLPQPGTPEYAEVVARRDAEQTARHYARLARSKGLEPEQRAFVEGQLAFWQRQARQGEAS